MGRSLIGGCVMLGMFVGGYLPVLWGGSTFGVASLLCGALGGVAGVWLGVRLNDSFE
jgi:hypothetical protein